MTDTLVKEHDEVQLHGELTGWGNMVKYLPEFVYGGIDGIVTTFAVVAGATGANLELSVVLILWFANLFADGFSMAVGAYLAEKSEHDTYRKHLDIEYREIEHMYEKEVEEIREIYAAKWFEWALLEQVVQVIIADKDRWVDVMMKEELELSTPDKSPRWVWVATLTSFVVIGFVPLFTYVLAYTAQLADTSLFPLSILLSAIAFMFIGWMKGWVTQSSKIQAIAETLILGALAAWVAYYVGFFLEKIITG